MISSMNAYWLVLCISLTISLNIRVQFMNGNTNPSELSIQVDKETLVRQLKQMALESQNRGDKVLKVKPYVFYTIENGILNDEIPVIDYLMNEDGVLEDKIIKVINRNYPYYIDIARINGSSYPNQKFMYSSRVFTITARIKRNEFIRYSFQKIVYQANILDDDDELFLYAGETLNLVITAPNNFDIFCGVVRNNRRSGQKLPDDLILSIDISQSNKSDTVGKIKEALALRYYDDIIQDEWLDNILLFKYDDKEHRLYHVSNDIELRQDQVSETSLRDDEIVGVILDYALVSSATNTINIWDQDKIMDELDVSLLIRQIELMYIPSISCILHSFANTAYPTYTTLMHQVSRIYFMNYRLLILDIIMPKVIKPRDSFDVWKRVWDISTKSNAYIRHQKIDIKLLYYNDLNYWDITKLHESLRQAHPLILSPELRKQFLDKYFEEAFKLHLLGHVIIPAHLRLSEFIIEYLKYQFVFTSNIILTSHNEASLDIHVKRGIMGTTDYCSSGYIVIKLVDILSENAVLDIPVSIELIKQIIPGLSGPVSHIISLHWKLNKFTITMIHKKDNNLFTMDTIEHEVSSLKYRIQIEFQNMDFRCTDPIYLSNTEFTDFDSSDFVSTMEPHELRIFNYDTSNYIFNIS